ncbi:cytochrome P450 [Chytridium lagenaria]|nr:cytochrome P450 [Chytridium lagenaria]
MGMQIVLTVDPVIIEHVLKGNFEAYEKGRYLTNGLRPLLGDGIFNTDGDNWKWQRKVSSHIFTGRNFRQVIEKVVKEDLQSLTEVLGRYADAQEPVDLHMLFHAFTLDSFGKIAFGISFNSLETPTSPPPFAVSLDASISLLRNLLATPLSFIWGHLDGSFTRLHKHIAVVDGLADRCIQEKRRKEDLEGDRKERMDLLDLYMDPRRYEKGTAPTDRQLRDMVLNMILAGRDTTAQALSWTFFEIMNRPDIIEEINKEAVEVLGEKGSWEVPGYDDVSKLKFANAVFFEALRLHPSVPIETKASITEDILPGGIKIPANTRIVWHNYTMGRLESLWGPDALLFNPTAGSMLQSPFKYNVFNAGPRTCLGQQMATYEAVAAMVFLVKRFGVALSKDAKPVRYGSSFTLPMKDGMRVDVTRVEG